MQPIPRSIKGRLFFGIILVIAVLLIVRAVAIYAEIKEAVFLSAKNSLHSKIQILKGLLYEKDGMIGLREDDIISGEYIIPRSGYYYKVAADGRTIAASPSLVENNYNLISGKPDHFDEEIEERIYYSTGPDNEPIMVIQHDFRILDTPVQIFAAQSIQENLGVLAGFRSFFFVSVPLYLIAAACAGIWIVKRSLRPLKTLSSKLEGITHKTLSERIDAAYQVEEIRGLAESFNSMLDRLQRAFDAEKRLIADASHELKTPLAVIRTRCDVLLQKDRTKDEYSQSLSTIRSTSDTLTKLLDNMLSLARLDSGVLSVSDFKAVSLKGCISKAVRLTEVLAREKDIKINVSIAHDITVSGDENMLVEALLNIMENAVRYNSREGSVHVTVEKSGVCAAVHISDNGPGIERQELERIFQRFYRIDQSRCTKGAGLGLSISKAIIEAHGGDIRVNSTFGEGSCFTVQLPVPE